MDVLDRSDWKNRFRPAFFLSILSFLAFTGNFVNLPLLPGIDFVFGSISVLIITSLYGIFWGTAVAAIAGITTYFHWLHPYAIVLFTVEALAVGLMLRYQKRNLIILDGIYWLLAGVPLVWVTYYGFLGIGVTPAILFSLKLAVNGLFNAMAANLILTHMPVRKWTGLAGISDNAVTVRQILFNLLVTFVMISTLLYTFAESMREQEKLERSIRSRLEKDTLQITNHMVAWHQQHLRAVNELAEAASAAGLRPSEFLQMTAQHIRNSFTDFVAVMVCNDKGTSIAYYPPGSNDLRYIGLSFADRDYFINSRDSLKPVISDVFVGRASAPFPLVAVSVPIIENGKFSGIAAGGLDLSYVKEQLRLSSSDLLQNATIIDSKGMVIASTQSGVKPLSGFDYRHGGEMVSKGSGIYQWFPANRDGLTEAMRWEQSIYMREVSLGNHMHWKLIVEVPVEPYVTEMQENSIKKLVAVLFLAVLALISADVVSRRLSNPLLSLAMVTSNLPDELAGRPEIGWPSSSVVEIHSLVGNFQSMAGALSRSFEFLQQQSAAMKASMDGIAVLDAQGRFVYMNDAHARIYGFDNPEPLLGEKWTFLYSEDERKRFSEDIIPKFMVEGHWRGEAVARRRDDTLFPQEISLTLIEGGGLVSVVRDVSERKKAEELIIHQAYHDPLTKLPNRTLFNDRLSHALTQAHRSGEKLAVLFLDLDRFKLVNDMLGHAMGDILLKEVAVRLSHSIRESDTIARLGGDEFTLILPKLHDEKDAALVAEKILHSFQEPFILVNHEFHVTTSIGIAMYPEDGEDTETLMKHADTAMYRAKERGRNNYQLFTSAMNQRIIQRLALENSLRYAVERSEFAVYYQPQVNAENNRVIGVEALLRWNHPERGIVSPAEFIPVAEETGLIVPIGEWVLGTACRQNKAWQDAGYTPVKVTVNLSAHQFRQKDLAALVAQVLRETGLSPVWLELEITEGVAMEDVEFTISVLQELKEMGVRIAIDDFGTGYSSLNYLKRFPIHTLKIDRSFVRDIAIDPDDAAIVSTIIGLARNLKLDVVAEGVETEEQLLFLRQRGCVNMQGFFFSRPVPEYELSYYLNYGRFGKDEAAAGQG